LAPKAEELIDIHRLDELKLGYESRLQRTEKKYQNLEQKLEKIRNLISDNEIDKLKTLMKKGQI
jgi:hypothetical protein